VSLLTLAIPPWSTASQCRQAAWKSGRLSRERASNHRVGGETQFGIPLEGLFNDSQRSLKQRHGLDVFAFLCVHAGHVVEYAAGLMRFFAKRSFLDV